MAETKKPLVFRDRDTKEKIPFYVKTEDVELPDGTDIGTKVAELEEAIGNAGDGTVTGVKVGSNTYEPTEGVVDISGAVPTSTNDLSNDSGFTTKTYVDAAVQAVQTALNNLMNGQSVTDAIDTFNEVKAFLEGINSQETLAAKLATLVPNTTTVNGKQLNGNIVIGMADIPGLLQAIANAGSGAVSVTTNQDGTFVIHVGETDYTINLNHTHENMAKIVKCTEATLPQTLADDTIYVQVDNLATPTEIEALHIFGLEFAGGGVPAGTPAITKPSGTTINLGENSGSGVSKAIEIKANSHITGDLTVGLAANSDLSFDTSNLPSGVTYNSGAGTLTIAQATAMQGVNITVVYSGSGAAEIDGGLVISGGGASPKSMVVEVVAAPVALKGVKLNGSQWMLTDYKPNPDTELLMKVHFERNSNSMSASANDLCGILLSCELGESDKKFMIYSSRNAASNNQYGNHNLWMYNSNGVKYGSGSKDYQTVSFNTQADANNFIADGLQIQYVKGSSNGVLKVLNAGGTVLKSVNTTLHNVTQENPLRIGIGRVNGTQTETLYAMFDVTIEELVITEGGVEMRHYMPVIKNGVNGLLDSVTGAFISSQTNTPLVAVHLS